MADLGIGVHSEMLRQRVQRSFCEILLNMKTKPIIRCSNGVRSCSGSTQLCYRLRRGSGLASLPRDMRNKEAKIRFYYIRSVKWIDQGVRKPGLYQTGCGLNLMGGYATLCTCKHEMLKFIHKTRRESPKRPIYVAVLGSTKGRRPNSKITPLVFLGKVEKSFDSFQKIWKYLPRRVRHAKDVRFHALGDLYPPSLVRIFREIGRISSSRFAKNFVHARESYKKDLKKRRPIVFKEWKAWPEADKAFTERDGNSVAPQERRRFKKIIAKPRPSPSGWPFSLTDLRSLMRRKVL